MNLTVNLTDVTVFKEKISSTYSIVSVECTTVILFVLFVWLE